MSMSLDKTRELTIRSIAASILAKMWRDRGQPLKHISLHAKKLGMSTEELISELNRRFEAIGLKLKIVENNKQASSSNAEVFVVIDPELKIAFGVLDKITSAVLALIYVKAGTQPISVEDVLRILEQILKDESKAREILEKAIRKLEKLRFAKIDHEKKLIELTSKALAVLPEREDLESMLIEVID